MKTKERLLIRKQDFSFSHIDSHVSARRMHFSLMLSVLLFQLYRCIAWRVYRSDGGVCLDTRGQARSLRFLEGTCNLEAIRAVQVFEPHTSISWPRGTCSFGTGRSVITYPMFRPPVRA